MLRVPSSRTGRAVLTVVGSVAAAGSVAALTALGGGQLGALLLSLLMVGVAFLTRIPHEAGRTHEGTRTHEAGRTPEAGRTHEGPHAPGAGHVHGAGRSPETGSDVTDREAVAAGDAGAEIAAAGAPAAGRQS